MICSAWALVCSTEWLRGGGRLEPFRVDSGLSFSRRSSVLKEASKSLRQSAKVRLKMLYFVEKMEHNLMSSENARMLPQQSTNIRRDLNLWFLHKSGKSDIIPRGENW
jgi:hypothetical protein